MAEGTLTLCNPFELSHPNEKEPNIGGRSPQGGLAVHHSREPSQW